MNQDITQLSNDQILQWAIDLARTIYGRHNLLFVPPAEPVGFVYFGYSETVGRMKIGYTDNLARREKQIRGQFTALSLDGDFQILGAAVAPQAIAQQGEKWAHQQLDHLRHKGEWFTASGEVYDLMLGGLQDHLNPRWAAWLDNYGTADMMNHLEFGLGRALGLGSTQSARNIQKYADQWREFLATVPVENCREYLPAFRLTA